MTRPRHGQSLRRTLTTASVAVTVAAIALCGVFIWATRTLKHVNESNNVNMISVRAAEEAKVGLLRLTVLGRAGAAWEREEIETELTRDLESAERHVTSASEQLVVEDAEAKVNAYLALLEGPAPPRLEASRAEDAAYRALDQLVATNLDQSSALHERAVRLNTVTNAAAAASGAAFLSVMVLLLWWLRYRWLQPILSLVEAIRQYATDKRVRTPAVGPAEIQVIASSFNDLAAELARQSDSQRVFLAGVAHDLRNPLAALKMSCAMVAPNKPLPPEEKIRAVIARVERQIARMDRMVWDLLDAARIESGQLELRREPVDLYALSQSVVDLFAPATRGHELKLDGPDGPVLAECDPLRLEQVLSNLLSNALKYSPKGGEVVVTVRREGGEVILSVTDAGIGMNGDQLTHLFEPFSRRGSSREQIPGVGLGLFVTRRIVEAHGGRIVVRSAPGRGTTFEVRLPVLAEVALTSNQASS